MNRLRRAHRKAIPRFEVLEHRWLLAVNLVEVSPGRLGNHLHADARAVDVGDDLQLTFSRPVTKGNGVITIRHRDDNTLVESIDVTSSRVRVSGANVTVDPANNLPADADLYITVSPTAFRAPTGGGVINSVLLDEDFDQLALENSFLDRPLDDYVVTVRGELNVTTAGVYTLGVNGDDGQLLSVDVAQDGLALLEDVLIFDDARHTSEDRLHTCGVLRQVSSCVGGGMAPALLLNRGTYAFEYRYFDRGGGSGGEFFYAPGYHEAFNPDAFVLVGDGSNGIGATSIKATLYKAVEGLSINDLTTANLVAQSNFIVVPSAFVESDGTRSSAGRNATFVVDRARTAYTLELLSAGDGYQVDDQLLIRGDDVGGREATNDIIIDVLAVTPNGGIEQFSFRGVAEDPDACSGAEDSLRPSACLNTVDLFDSGLTGRFDVNHPVPGAEEWKEANDKQLHNWTATTPAGWIRNQSQLESLRPNGPPEYQGWTFLDRSFWIDERHDNGRSLFTAGKNTVAVVDPNGFDSLLDIDATGDATRCLTSRSPQDCGFFSGDLVTPRIALDNVVQNTAVLTFDSSWWNEDTQAAELWVEYFANDGRSLANNRLFRWDSIASSPFFKPVIDPDTGADARNEAVRVELANPENAASLRITFRMPHAQNDWWWAIDNVKVTADTVGSEFFPGVDNNSTWRFTTKPLVQFDPPTLRVPEDAGSIKIEVARMDKASNPWAFEVDYQVLSGSATNGEFDDEGQPTAGADFVTSTESSLEFPSLTPSSLRQSIFVTIVDDDLAEGNETFRIRLSNPPVPGAGQITAIFAATELLVTIVDDEFTALPGDIDNDGSVGFSDFLIISENFGKQVAAGTRGDIDGDGQVGFVDFLVISQNFGRSLAAPAATDEVFAAQSPLSANEGDEALEVLALAL